MSDRMAWHGMAWTTPYNTMAEYNSRIEEVEHQPNQPKTIIKLTDGRVEIIPTQQNTDFNAEHKSIIGSRRIIQFDRKFTKSSYDKLEIPAEKSAR